MNFLTRNTVARIGKRFPALHRLRKVKFFIQRRTVTIVTYYKQTVVEECHQYEGRAYIFTYTTWKGTCVSLAHNSHLPPPEEVEAEQDQELEEIELEPSPILPGFGFSRA